MKNRAATALGVAAAALLAAMLAIWWPGVAQYDAVNQYSQVVTDAYDDWHPPIMARTWALLHPLGAGTAPMFVLQAGAYWLGLGALAVTLGRLGRWRAGAAVLVIGGFPLLIGWQASVLKDSQMLAALMLAAGLVAWWRLRGVRLPIAAVVAVVVLLGYAVMLRANGLFAAVPLGAMLLPGPGWRRLLAAGGAAAAILMLTPLLNHDLLGATRSNVAATLPIYDLVGIEQRAGPGATGVLTPGEDALVTGQHCYTAFYWDPLGDDATCGAIAARLDSLPRPALLRSWLIAIATHPLAYLAHRLAHWNSTERWLVAAGEANAIPPGWSEANDLGLVSPPAASHAVVAAAAAMVPTPLGWPISWAVIAAIGIAVAVARPAGPARDLALALGVSGLSLELSFTLVSIASDLRYHLWVMAASAVMVVLLATPPWPRRRLLAGGAALAVVTLAGIGSRLLMTA